MWAPKVQADGFRRYRCWAGNPAGRRENKLNCIASVADGGRSVLSHQCARKRGHGPSGEFCKQHAAKAERQNNL